MKLKLKKEKSFALFLTITFITVFFSIFSYTLYLFEKNNLTYKNLNFVEKSVIVSNIENILKDLTIKEIDEVLKKNKNKFELLIKNDSYPFEILIDLNYKKELFNINFIKFFSEGKDLDLLNKILFFENIEKPDIVIKLLQERFLLDENYWMVKDEFQEILFEYYLQTNDLNIFKLDIDKYFTFDNVLINYKGITKELLYIILYPNLNEEQVVEYISQKNDLNDFSSKEREILNFHEIYFDKSKIFCNIHILNKQKNKIENEILNVDDRKTSMEKFTIIYNLIDKKVVQIND